MEPKELRNRVVEMVVISSGDLVDHNGNYRKHPQAQKNAFRGVVEQIGIAGALVAYKSERNGGKLTVIDGHMRKNDFPTEWPVLVTDLNDKEADLLLQAYDPLSAMAVADQRKLAELQKGSEFDDTAVRVMIDQMPNLDRILDREAEATEAAMQVGMTSRDRDKQAVRDGHIAEMELQPYEHYDYVMVLARNVWDWNWLSDRLGLEKVDGANDARHPKVGLGRVIPAEKLILMLRRLEELEGKDGD